MKRRAFTASLLVSIAGGCARSAASTSAPEKIHLVPDDYRIEHAGHLADGRLFWVDVQLNSANGQTQDFVCTYVFDADGNLSANPIELIGARGEYQAGAVEQAIGSQLTALGAHTQAAIWVRPFQVESHGAVFGLVPRQTPDGEWRVEAMPGNTLSFYAPWEAGEYDT
jgi:hypothetical protein